MAYKYDICFLSHFTSLLFLTFLFGNSLSLHRDGECIQDGCKCIFPNNKYIDISQKVPLTRIDIKGENNSAIIFHPCQNFVFGNKAEGNECFDGASICLLNTINNNTKILGKAGTGVFSSLDSVSPIKVTYSRKLSSTETTLSLLCKSNIPETVEASKIEEKYNLVWSTSSNAACPLLLPGIETSLSTGSVLVIMLLFFSLLYFGGGMLALKFLRGAEGREMIPNYDFWADLPYLVRDGVLFALGGFNTPTSYDRI